MPRIKLVVAYDGTDFKGWSSQADQRTVESTLKEAVRKVSGEEIEVVGASRTDSGAHAKGQVCHFDVCAKVPVDKWRSALNRLLPGDVAVMDAKIAPDTFHSRFSARARRYVYRIRCGDRDAHENRFSFESQWTLDAAKMRQAAEALIGEHDFRALCVELPEHIENTRRNLFRIHIEEAKQEVAIQVTGTAFLRGMMRRIAGLLFEVGRGDRPVDHASALVESAEAESVRLPVVLPARGLCLLTVLYGRHPRDFRAA